MARSKKTTAAAKQPAPIAKPVTPTTKPRRGGSRPVRLRAVPALEPMPVPSPAMPFVSKQARIIAALRRPEGASVAELMGLTGWLSHSVRGVLSGALKRKLGLVLDSRVEPDRGRVYRIVDPQPMPSGAAVAPASTSPSGSGATRRVKRASTGVAAAASA